MVKKLDQAARDSQRKTYRLSFPSDLDGEMVTAWVRSISGTLRGSRLTFTGLPTIAFEMWASNRGIVHRLKVPWQHADYVVAQLRSLVPGIRVEPEDEWPWRPWTRAVEVGLTHSTRPLRIYSSADMAASLLASVQALDDDEVVMLQWVLSPASPRHLPIHKQAQSDHVRVQHLWNGNMANKDEVNERRQKLAEPNMLGVLRVAAHAESKPRADHLIYKVRASLASARGPSSRFVKRWVGKQTLQKRIETAAGSVIFPVQLSAPEVTALLAWPVGNPFVSGLPQAMTKHLAASQLVARDGRIIGRSNFPGNERPIALAYADATKHMHIVGPTGVGKTALLANMLKQDVEHGYGAILIENKGDLFHAAMDYIPANRINDVIVLDVSDNMRPVGFNILDQGDPMVAIDELTALFDHLYKDSRSVWTREVMYHGLRTLASGPNLSFVDLAPLLVPMNAEEHAWRDQLIRNLTDRELRNFWQRFENQPRAAQDRITQPVMDRIWQLNARPEIRNIIGQSKSSFQMEDVIRDNKILLVNLAGLPRETASLMGTLLMNTVWHAARTVRPQKSNFLYLDEFQDFIDLPVDPETMLTKARGFGLGMVLAHQHLKQLPSNLQGAVQANARTKVVFQTSADDASAMSREFGRAVDESDFQLLGQYEAISRIATGEGVTAPMTLTTNAPAKGYGKTNAVRYTSRQQFSRAVAEVRKEIDERRDEQKLPKKERPKLTTWGQETETA